MPSREPLSGGLTLTKQMQDIIKQPGPLSIAKGGQRLRKMYQRESLNFEPSLISEFATACFIGHLNGVKSGVQAGAIDINSTETPFKYGYASFVVFGSQRVSPTSPRQNTQHAEVLQYLLSTGMNPDVEDITGLTALYHTTSCPVERADIARVLLEGGANVNHQTRFGDVALFGAFQHNLVKTIDVLMEFNADLNIVEADGYTPMMVFLSAGPHVTATMQKWIRKRAGAEAPRDGKRCNQCGNDGADGIALKICARCKVAQYCTATCQRAHWPTHKKTCQPFSDSTIVTVKPCYNARAGVMPSATLTRQFMGYPTPDTPEAHKRSAHTPKDIGHKAKSLIIKVQVPLGPVAYGDLFVYTKKRDFVASVKRTGNAAGYDRLAQVIRSKGVGGAKAYFAAELKSKDELVIKVAEVLAEQPF